MNLNEALVEQMKQTAKQFPMEAGDMASVECLQTNVEFEGHKLNILLTNDSINKEGIWWHLSVANANDTAPVQEISQKVARMFLGDFYKILPKLAFPPNMQFMDQYVKLID
jgi:hypothetical protein